MRVGDGPQTRNHKKGRLCNYRRSLLNIRSIILGNRELEVGGIEYSGYGGISGSGIVGGGAQSAVRSLDLDRRRSFEPPGFPLPLLR